MHSFEVQWNESAYRKSGHLGLDQVRSQKILGFTSTEGGRSTELGVPYLYSYPESYSSVSILPHLFHHPNGRHFSTCNVINNRTRIINSGVALEKFGATQSVYFRPKTQWHWVWGLHMGISYSLMEFQRKPRTIPFQCENTTIEKFMTDSITPFQLIVVAQIWISLTFPLMIVPDEIK